MKLRTKPIDIRFMDATRRRDTHTICGFLRQVHNAIDDENLREKLRIAAGMAKSMSYRLKMIRDGVDPKWECEMCGECCKSIAFPVKPYVPEVEDEIELETWDINKESVFWVIHKFPCKHLTSDNKCSIYDDRPETCRAFNCGGKSGEKSFQRKVFTGERVDSGNGKESD